jgi:hypothetical protein
MACASVDCKKQMEIYVNATFSPFSLNALLKEKVGLSLKLFREKSFEKGLK